MGTVGVHGRPRQAFFFWPEILMGFCQVRFSLKEDGFFHKDRFPFILRWNDFRVDKKGALVQIQIRI
jgi:hypothetical protein